MISLPLILLLTALAFALLTQLLIPYLERGEQRRREELLAATKALHFLKNRIKPGIYTFRWERGRMLEPQYEKQEGQKVVVRFADGKQVTERLEEMPDEFRRQVLRLIRAGVQPR
ncbi:hypothetical protein [Trichloromonas sp.]|uniref:hypothetical protein n=1 Tax=Trichloromonas sp. TaxID=3069249 RepID=UPI002A4CA0E5|nr:hypothetical protein [Trichloromonas sp.]